MAFPGSKHPYWTQGRRKTDGISYYFPGTPPPMREIPHGIETPDGIIWGKTSGGFIDIMTLLRTIWSRSMVRELGRNGGNEEHGTVPSPKTQKPWSLLRLPGDSGLDAVDPVSNGSSDLVECSDVFPKMAFNDVEKVQALSNNDSVRKLFEEGYGKYWTPGELEIVLESLGQDEASRSEPRLVVFRHLDERYFLSGTHCLTCKKSAAFACPKCTVELPAIVSVLRYNTPNTESIENSRVQRFNPLDGKYGKVIAALWLDGSLTGKFGPKVLRFPGDPSFLYCAINLDCKTCGGGEFPDCDDCGLDNTEPIYARFDKDGKPWIADVNGKKVRGEGDPGLEQESSSSGNSEGPPQISDNREESAPRTGLLAMRIFEDREKQDKPQNLITAVTGLSIQPVEIVLDIADLNHGDAAKVDIGTDTTAGNNSTSTAVSPEMPPSLEEKIPPEFLPDVLVVKDADGTTISYHSRSCLNGDEISSFLEKPVKFNRVFPSPAKVPNRSSESSSITPTLRVAELRLSLNSKLGTGSHSDVYLVPLRLPNPLSARTPTGEVAVACKMAHMRSGEGFTLLANEACMYASFPDHFFEGWTGYTLGTPELKNPVPIGPIVPKFYGYYKPIYDPEYYADEEKLLDDATKGKMKSYIEGLSPILLMENCGTQVSPYRTSQSDTDECMALLHHLHLAQYTHGSAHPRNVLVQPGPLTVAPSSRNMEHPSFRLVDFGRTERKENINLWKRSQYEIGQLRAEIGNDLFGIDRAVRCPRPPSVEDL